MSVQSCLSASGTREIEFHQRTIGTLDASGSLAAARARLQQLAMEAGLEKRKSRDITAKYYGQKRQLEEVIEDVQRREAFDAVLTRNHYGCVVMNAARALFIDVDFAGPSEPEREHAWQRMFDDLRLVLADDRENGYRIYRTAAGFRMLATTREFEPGEPHAQRVMSRVGADIDFVNLCRLQKCFRARLTPKPWRCGAKRPPNPFPRTSREAKRQFAEWVVDYERACRDRATCKYLGHVGRTRVADALRPIVDVHDRETRAFESLPLA